MCCIYRNTANLWHFVSKGTRQVRANGSSAHTCTQSILNVRWRPLHTTQETAKIFLKMSVVVCTPDNCIFCSSMCSVRGPFMYVSNKHKKVGHAATKLNAATVIEFCTTVKEDLWGFIYINIKTLETIGCAGSSINHQILPTNHTQNSRLPYHYGMTIFIVGIDFWENHEHAEYQLLCHIIFQDIFPWGLFWSVRREVFMLIIGPPFI